MKIERRVVILNTLGLHVRPAVLFATTASKYKSSIIVSKNNCFVNGKSSIELLTLASAQGSEINIIADGDDAEAAICELESLVKSKFGEGEES